MIKLKSPLKENNNKLLGYFHQDHVFTNKAFHYFHTLPNELRQYCYVKSPA